VNSRGRIPGVSLVSVKHVRLPIQASPLFLKEIGPMFINLKVIIEVLCERLDVASAMAEDRYQLSPRPYLGRQIVNS
jgi:hypothetical protein